MQLYCHYLVHDLLKNKQIIFRYLDICKLKEIEILQLFYPLTINPFITNHKAHD